MKRLCGYIRVQLPLVKLFVLIITLAGCSENNDVRHPDTLLLDEAEILTEIWESVAEALVNISGNEILLVPIKSKYS